MHDTSIDRDIDVFLRNYVRKSQGKNIEENLSGILQELTLVEKTGKYDSEDLYKIESSERADLPALIVLFGIARQMRGSASISFQELLNGFDSVGSVFALNANGLMLKIEELLLLFPQDIVFTDDGGIRLLQFKKQFSEIEILTHYYEAQFVTVG